MTVNQQLRYLDLPTVDKPQILVVGCGTGLQVIQFALANRGGEVTAIDISAVALHYGKLMAARYGLNNIDFRLLDVEDINSIGKRFDCIVASGVLQHMRDPQLGLNRLSGILNNQGFMLIGLYSQLARSSLVGLRQQALGFNLNNQDSLDRKKIRDWRYQWTTEQKREYWYNHPDCFYLNGLMDVVFHPQETSFTLPEVKEMLNNASISFRTMQLSTHIRMSYAKQLAAEPMPLDGETLAYWEEFEQKYPLFFGRMYNFYAVKV